jgi:hypothetical protein
MVAWFIVLLSIGACDLLALKWIMKKRPLWSSAEQALAAIAPGHIIGLLPLAILLVPLPSEMTDNDERPLMFGASLVLTIVGQISAFIAELAISVIAAGLPASK